MRFTTSSIDPRKLDRQDAGGISGSRERSQSSVSSPIGFDPGRVRVTAADFNGQSWDGLPFDHVPKWLETALRQGAICIKRDDRDYALWAVETPEGVKVAGPGDDIVCLDGHFDVRKGRLARSHRPKGHTA